MKYYAVIDTNVLVSAMLKCDSIPGYILELIFSGVIIPLFNETITKEYQGVLRRPKFHLTESIIRDVLDEMNRFGVCVDAPELAIDLPDINDRVFYEVVMEKRKTEDAYLITGNIRHFPDKPYVVTPRHMLDIIIGDMNE